MLINRKQWIGFTLVLIILALAGIGCSAKNDADGGDSAAQQVTTNNQNIRVVSNTTNPSNTIANSPALQATPTALPPDTLVQARAVENVFVNIYERVNPSVVNIEVVGSFSVNDAIDSSGSGFVYDKEGHIVTNAHVVLGASEVLVTFWDGSVAEAEIIGVDEYSDLGVIKVDVNPDLLVPVELGNSDQVVVGQYVVAIGNPFGLRSSMTIGFISATGRTLDSQSILDPSPLGNYGNPAIIQVDATINPGNSGGPILNLDGQVIGVATAIRSESGVFEGIAYAVPVNTVKVSVPQLIEDGTAEYPRLGITSSLNNNVPGLTIAAVANELNLPVNHGVLVDQVVSGSPAEQAGIRGSNSRATVRGIQIGTGGDIIIGIDGVFIADIDELLEYLIHHTHPGQTITLTIIRDGQTLEVDLVLGSR